MHGSTPRRVLLVLASIPSLSYAFPNSLFCENDSLFSFIQIAKNGNTDKVRNCAWVRNKESQREKFCEFQDIEVHCPISCGICCDDNPFFTFILPDQPDNQRKTCRWISKNASRKQYCNTFNNGRMVQDACPKACDFCLPPIGSGAPSMSPTDNPTAKPTRSPSDRPSLSIGPTASPSVSRSSSPSSTPTKDPSSIPSTTTISPIPSITRAFNCNVIITELGAFDDGPGPARFAELYSDNCKGEIIGDNFKLVSGRDESSTISSEGISLKGMKIADDGFLVLCVEAMSAKYGDDDCDYNSIALDSEIGTKATAVILTDGNGNDNVHDIYGE